MSTNEQSEVRQGIVILLLYALIMFLPFIGFILFLLLPLLMIYYVNKFRTKSAIVLGVIILFINIWLAHPIAIYFSLVGIIVGITMGSLYKQTKHTNNTFYPYIGGLIGHVATILLFFVLLKAVFGIDFNQYMQQEMANLESTMLAQEGLFQVPFDDAQLTEYLQFLLLIIPVFIILASAIFAAFNHLLARVILKRFGISIQQLPPLREWQFPRAFIYWYLLSLLLLLIGLMDEGGPLYPILINVQTILEVVMYLQGLAVIAYFSHIKKKGFLLPAITIGLTLLFPLMVMLFVRILGILELGFGLRARMRPPE